MAAEARSFHACEVEKLERELFEAYQRRDISGLDRILDDHIFIAPNGQIRTKETVRNFSWPLYERLEVDEIRVRIYGEAAVLTGRVTIQGQPGMNDPTGEYRHTRVYVRARRLRPQRQGGVTGLLWRRAASVPTGTALKGRGFEPRAEAGRVG